MLATLHVFAVIVLGLMCGSELNVAIFAHPTLTRPMPRNPKSDYAGRGLCSDRMRIRDGVPS
jgi:hypothetical protein